MYPTSLGRMTLDNISDLDPVMLDSSCPEKYSWLQY